MSAHLKLEFAITSGVDVGERRAGSGERLRIGNAARCAEDTEELITLTAEAAKQAEFRVDGMIQPDAVGVKRRRIRVAGIELGQPRSK